MNDRRNPTYPRRGFPPFQFARAGTQTLRLRRGIENFSAWGARWPLSLSTSNSAAVAMNSGNSPRMRSGTASGAAANSISAASRAYRVEPDQFLIIDERQPHFWERPKVDADRLRAFLRAALFKEIAQDRMVFASSSGTQLLPANGFALRVRALAAFPIRVRHICRSRKTHARGGRKAGSRARHRSESARADAVQFRYR